MPYQGNRPAENYTKRDYQDFTGGSGQTFTLNKAVAATHDLTVVVNNVVQDPADYSVNGTSLTLGGSVSATDDFYVVFNGPSTQSLTHPSDQALEATSVDTPNVVNAGDVSLKTNGQANRTHSFNFNEGGGEMHLRDASGNSGGFLDYGSAFGTRVLNAASTGNMEIGQAAANTTGNVRFMGAGYVERAVIDSGGRMGIGTNSPSTYDNRNNNLVVGDSGDSGITIFSGASSDGRLVFATEGQTGLSNGSITYDQSADNMDFEVGGSRRARIDSYGSLNLNNQPTAGGMPTQQNPVWQDGPYHINISANLTNIGNNTSGSTFTAPVAGRYLVSCSFLIGPNSSATSYYLYLQKNSVSVAYTHGTAYASQGFTQILDLNANDTIRFYLSQGRVYTSSHGMWCIAKIS